MQLSKMLPIRKNPPIKAYLNYAHLLSIILTEDDADEWFFSNFIQLYSHRNSVVSWSIVQLLPDNYYLLHDQYLYNVHHLNSEIVGLDKEQIVDLLIKWIDNGYYIIYYLDEYYLPGTQLYQKVHFPHAQLLYGYDKTKEIFNTLNYTETREYTSIDISFKDVENSLITEELYREVDWSSFLRHDNPRLIKRTNKTTEEISTVKDIIEQLKDYLNSYGSYIHAQHNHEIAGLKDLVWGISIYDNFCNYLHKTGDNRSFEPFQLLLEHKQVMVMRFEFLEKKYNIKIPQTICDGLEEVEQLAQKLRNLSVKYIFKKEEKLKNRMIELLMLIKVREKAVLAEALAHLEKNA